MKRIELENLVGQRVNFTGTLSCYGTKPKPHYFQGKISPRINRKEMVVTLCFRDIYINGIYIDHMWVSDARRLRTHDIRVGSVVSFTGKIHPYVYGEGYEIGDKRDIKILKEGKGNNLIEYLKVRSNRINFSNQYIEYMNKLEKVL